MERSIIPQGFESTSHSVFRSFVRPLPLPQKCSEVPSAPAGDESLSAVESHEHPLLELRGGPNAARGALVCPICLDAVSDAATLVWCRHRFCTKCLLSWFKVNVMCPICKQKSSYFLRGCSHNTAQPEVKMWAIDGEDDSQCRPSSVSVAAAVAVHEEACVHLCDRKNTDNQSVVCSPKQKKRKLAA